MIIQQTAPQETAPAPKSALLELREIYGNPLAYPICDSSKRLARLLRKKTLDGADISFLIQEGYKVNFDGSQALIARFKTAWGIEV